MEIGGEKMRKSDQQGENERQCRKKWTGTRQNIWWAHTTYSNIKFHIVVVQNNVKEMYKKVCCARARLLLLFFFANICHSSKIFGSDNKPKTSLN